MGAPHDTSAAPSSANPPGGTPRISVVVSAFNERDNLEELHERLTKTLCDYDKSFELVYVDDGSSDGSFEFLKGLLEGDSHVRIIRFVRNFGQQAAILAGFNHVHGETVVLIDADLQTWPEDIPQLVDKIEEGYDLVYGVREHRADSMIRRVGSRAVSRLMREFTGVDVPDSASGFVALRREVVDHAVLYKEKSRYLLARLAWLGAGNSTSVTVRHAPRARGDSKYTFGQLVTLVVNLVCNHSTAPLRLSLFAGIFVAAGSLTAFALLAIDLLVSGLSPYAPFWFLTVALCFLGGVQLVCVGILGEYVARIHREVRDQPLYIIGETLG